jgi:hypothetical protein
MAKVLLFLFWATDVLSWVALRIRNRLVVGEVGYVLSDVVDSCEKKIVVVRVLGIERYAYSLELFFGIAFLDGVTPEVGSVWPINGICRHRRRARHVR